MEKRPKIYVSGPISLGNHESNVRAGIDAAEELYKNNFIPYLPHTDTIWGLVHPHSWEEWLDLDLEWVRACDGLYRLKGESRGADAEVNLARELMLPVAYSIPTLVSIFYPNVMRGKGWIAKEKT